MQRGQLEQVQMNQQQLNQQQMQHMANNPYAEGSTHTGGRTPGLQRGHMGGTQTRSVYPASHRHTQSFPLTPLTNSNYQNNNNNNNNNINGNGHGNMGVDAQMHHQQQYQHIQEPVQPMERTIQPSVAGGPGPQHIQHQQQQHIQQQQQQQYGQHYTTSDLQGGTFATGQPISHIQQQHQRPAHNQQPLQRHNSVGGGGSRPSGEPNNLLASPYLNKPGSVNGPQQQFTYGNSTMNSTNSSSGPGNPQSSRSTSSFISVTQNQHQNDTFQNGRHSFNGTAVTSTLGNSSGSFKYNSPVINNNNNNNHNNSNNHNNVEADPTSIHSVRSSTPMDRSTCSTPTDPYQSNVNFNSPFAQSTMAPMSHMSNIKDQSSGSNKENNYINTMNTGNSNSSLNNTNNSNINVYPGSSSTTPIKRSSSTHSMSVLMGTGRSNSFGSMGIATGGRKCSSVNRKKANSIGNIASVSISKARNNRPRLTKQSTEALMTAGNMNMSTGSFGPCPVDNQQEHFSMINERMETNTFQSSNIKNGNSSRYNNGAQMRSMSTTNSPMPGYSDALLRGGLHGSPQSMGTHSLPASPSQHLSQQEQQMQKGKYVNSMELNVQNVQNMMQNGFMNQMTNCMTSAPSSLASSEQNSPVIAALDMRGDGMMNQTLLNQAFSHITSNESICNTQQQQTATHYGLNNQQHQQGSNSMSQQQYEFPSAQPDVQLPQHYVQQRQPVNHQNSVSSASSNGGYGNMITIDSARYQVQQQNQDETRSDCGPATDDDISLSVQMALNGNVNGMNVMKDTTRINNQGSGITMSATSSIGSNISNVNSVNGATSNNGKNLYKAVSVMNDLRSKTSASISSSAMGSVLTTPVLSNIPIPTPTPSTVSSCNGYDTGSDITISNLQGYATPMTQTPQSVSSQSFMVNNIPGSRSSVLGSHEKSLSSPLYSIQQQQPQQKSQQHHQGMGSLITPAMSPMQQPAGNLTANMTKLYNAHHMQQQQPQPQQQPPQQQQQPQSQYHQHLSQQVQQQSLTLQDSQVNFMSSPHKQGPESMYDSHLGSSSDGGFKSINGITNPGQLQGQHHQQQQPQQPTQPFTPSGYMAEPAPTFINSYVAGMPSINGGSNFSNGYMMSDMSSSPCTTGKGMLNNSLFFTDDFGTGTTIKEIKNCDDELIGVMITENITKTKTFECRVGDCTKKYKRRDHLIRHMKSHTDRDRDKASNAPKGPSSSAHDATAVK